MKNADSLSLRRRSIVLAAGAALASPALVHAQAEDIVLGGSIPMTGVFAFAGIGINAGIADYVKIVNDGGGIKGRKLRYVPEDTGYKVDVSVARSPARTRSTCTTATPPDSRRPSTPSWTAAGRS